MKFKVTTNKKDLPFVLLCFGGIEAVLICAAFHSPYLIYAVLAGIVGLLGISLLVAYTLFCVKVDNLEFHVRTNWGRRYSFSCSEIDKVSCVKRQNTRYGPMFYIVIVSNDRRLQIEATMTGFQQMASYILEQHDAGAIKKCAIDAKTISTLRRYAAGDIYGKSKSERSHEKQSIKQARTLSDFSTIEQAQRLFESVGCFGKENCCFVTYENAHAKYLPTTAITDDPYNGYLINKTETGFGMFPLMYRKKIARIKPSVMAVMEKDYFFIPNEKVKAVYIRPYHSSVGGETEGIVLDFEDRTLYLIAKTDEPFIPYHNDNLAAFVRQYKNDSLQNHKG